MHAIKGAWIGQVYALANSNDSGGRKSRIRRSKEERKELVVSFIKRHQKLNNGSFPSLNLTHKEVGGSFYTVREIVREIIQENRVLAPPKLLPGEHNMESFLEQYPLGSISVDPQINVVSSNENQILVNHHQYTSEEQVFDSRPIIELDQGKLDNGTIVNGSAHTDAKASKKPMYTGFLRERGAEGEKAGEKELDAYLDLVTESNISEGVGEETSFQKGHNVESFLEHGKLESSFVDPSPEEHNVESFLEQGTLESSLVDLSPEEHNIGSFLERGALESSFVDPQIDVGSIDENEIVVSHYQSTNEEQVFDARHISKSDQGRLVNGTIVNGGANAVAEIEESKELIYGESLLERGVDGDKAEAKEIEGDQATSQIGEGLLVETFPLRPVPHMDYDLDAKLNKPVILVGALKEQDTEDLEVEAENYSVPDRLHFLENSSEIVDKNTGTDLAGPLPETNGVLLDKQALPTKESTALDVNGTNLDVKDTLPTGNKPTVASNGVFAGNLRQATSDGAAANKKQSDIVDGDSSNKKGSDPTLDRTKLESWEATSEKPAGQETNPLMAFIQAFVTAFVKFWSE